MIGYSIKIKGRPLWICRDDTPIPCFTLGNKMERVIFETHWEAGGIAEKRVFGEDWKKYCYLVKEG